MDEGGTTSPSSGESATEGQDNGRSARDDAWPDDGGDDSSGSAGDADDDVSDAVDAYPYRGPPAALCCPITRRIFYQPVATVDGHTYERSALEEWTRRGNKTSPVTRERLPSSAFRRRREDPSSGALKMHVNFVAKQAVESYLGRDPSPPDPKTVIGAVARHENLPGPGAPCAYLVCDADTVFTPSCSLHTSSAVAWHNSVDGAGSPRQIRRARSDGAIAAPGASVSGRTRSTTATTGSQQ